MTNSGPSGGSKDPLVPFLVVLMIKIVKPHASKVKSYKIKTRPKHLLNALCELTYSFIYSYTPNLEMQLHLKISIQLERQ